MNHENTTLCGDSGLPPTHGKSGNARAADSGVGESLTSGSEEQLKIIRGNQAGDHDILKWARQPGVHPGQNLSVGHEAGDHLNHVHACL